MKIKSNTNEIVSLMSHYEKIEKYVIDESEKIPAYRKYHNKFHPIDVRDSALIIALVQGIEPEKREFWIMKTGAILHDIGQIPEVEKQFLGEGHEEAGAKFAENLLEFYGYNVKDTFDIGNIIRATKLPQNPKTILEEIVCDADLDNFGRDDFFEKGKLLREELEAMGIKKTDKEWYGGVLKLLESHRYHTEAARYLKNDKKRENIKKLKKIIESL